MRQDILADGQGGAFVSWLATTDLGAAPGNLYLARLTPEGTRAWSSDLIVTDGAIPTQRAQLVPDGGGGVFVLWENLATDVYLQHVSRIGSVLWSNPLRVNDVTTPRSRLAAIPDGAGGMIVAWSDHRSAADQVFAQRVSGDGSLLWSAPTMIAKGAFGGRGLMVGDGSGGAILAFINLDAGYSQARVQRISSIGVPLWHDGGVALRSSTARQLPWALVSTPDRGAHVIWTEGDDTNIDLFVTSFTAQGQLRWKDGTRVLSNADHTRSNVSAVPDGYGGAFVAWDDSRTRGLQLPHVYAQHLQANGAVRWAANGVHLGGAPANGFESEASLAADDHGGAWITWTEADALDGELLDIRGMHVNADGSSAKETPSGGITISGADGMQHQPEVVNLGNGRVFVDWVDQRQGDAEIDLYAWLSGVSSLAPAGSNANQPALHVVAHARGNAIDVAFELPQAAPVSILVTDVQGRAVARTQATLGQGSHQLSLDLGGTRDEMLFVTLSSAGRSTTSKAVRLR